MTDTDTYKDYDGVVHDSITCSGCSSVNWDQLPHQRGDSEPCRRLRCNMCGTTFSWYGTITKKPATFATIRKQYRKLKSREGKEEAAAEIACDLLWHSDGYWEDRETFTDTLRDALHDDALLRKVNKTQLVQLFAWFSTYRPAEPHAILSRLGRLAE